MRNLILILMLFGATAVHAATSYTEFYCRPDGTNVNAGSTTNAAAVVALDAGNWTNATSTFYLSGADLSGVTVGMWGSIWTNNPAPTNAAYVARITAVDDGADTITFSTTAIAGTIPGSDVGASSVRIGGAWYGMHHATIFPLNFAANSLTNVSWNIPRINFWSGYSNSSTVVAAHALAGPIVFQGYTSTPGDGGKAIFDGGAGAHGIVNVTGAGTMWQDVIFQNTSTATYYGLQIGADGIVSRCIANNIGASGFYVTSANLVTLTECEAYACCLANGAQQGGFRSAGGAVFNRCISHNNTAAKASGFSITGNGVIVNCIAVSNGNSGFTHSSALADGACAILGAEAFGNKTNGVEFSATDKSITYVENVNAIKNYGWGLFSTAGIERSGMVMNYGLGAGTMANALGGVSANIGATNGIYLGTSVTYANDTTPWANVAGNNYTILTTSSAYGAGRGNFTDTLNSGGTISYPDIGATAVTNAAASGGEHSHVFAQ